MSTRRVSENGRTLVRCDFFSKSKERRGYRVPSVLLEVEEQTVYRSGKIGITVMLDSSVLVQPCSHHTRTSYLKARKWKVKMF